MSAPRPYNLIAELTYRCPLRCPYCSNPVDYRDVRDGLDLAAWCRVFRDAAALGAIHVGLTGGEPRVRDDLPALVEGAAEAGLYTHLVTAGPAPGAAPLAELRRAGLRSVQLSIQDARAHESDAIAGARAFDDKLAFAAEVTEMELPLTLNVPIHRENIGRIDEIVALARRLGAQRLELANVQYYGWALRNRRALLPGRAQLEDAQRAVARAREQASRPEILFVLPDYFAGRPKPCMDGWGRRAIVVSPDGLVTPCQAARDLPGLEFWSVRDEPLARCWSAAPGMNAYRGDGWMPEPCRSCPEKVRDFGGCRCQAWALTGDIAATDPVCSLSPDHSLVLAARDEAESIEQRPALVHRGAAGG